MFRLFDLYEQMPTSNFSTVLHLAVNRIPRYASLLLLASCANENRLSELIPKCPTQSELSETDTMSLKFGQVTRRWLSSSSIDHASYYVLEAVLFSILLVTLSGANNLNELFNIDQTCEPTGE